MNARTLTDAAVDQSIAPLRFLPFVEEALRDSDPWTQDYAKEAFVLKVAQGSVHAWDELRVHLADEAVKTAEREYLLNIARLGKLFVDEAAASRDTECAQIVLWLIKNDPSDKFLENPWCYDFAGEPYESVDRAWSKVLADRPNEIQVLANAADFLCLRYPERAKSLFMRCRTLDPSNSVWSDRIAELDGS